MNDGHFLYRSAVPLLFQGNVSLMGSIALVGKFHGHVSLHTYSKIVANIKFVVPTW